jgi:hypothetical protein
LTAERLEALRESARSLERDLKLALLSRDIDTTDLDR